MADPDLLDRWLDGEADPAALRRWLAEDPERVRELLRRARFRRDLGDLVRSRAGREAYARRRRWWVPTAAAAAAVVGAAATAPWWWPAPSSPGTEASGIAGTRSLDAQPDDPRPTWRGGPAAGEFVAGPGDTLRWPDGSRIDPAAGTRLLVDAAGRPDLREGRVVATVQPRSEPFTIAAGDGEVVVLGTRFAVERDATAVQVQVETGRVALGRGGERIQLAAGAVGRLDAAGVRALPSAAWAVAPDAAWTGLLRAGGIAQVEKPEDSRRFGGTVRWIASPEWPTGAATLDARGTLVLDLSAHRPASVSVTLVLGRADDPAAWHGNLQRDLPVPVGDARFRMDLSGFSAIAGAAPAGRFTTVVRRLTLTSGGEDTGLVLRRAALEPGTL
jgi:ferric-dicitrate binding protein FerR (iron transport regulator)